ncbi:hypothetical protein AVEN_40911-1 [Araneus ventricosus]|uniref:Uncharacterized protein n=1 Tax=Araneus ventricosus TaxID=182803 RepID=A0A4Y2VM09_ARAVE|nr:hypothetical protein AVEN_40911-1 [Araneus ventricosus]
MLVEELAIIGLDTYRSQRDTKPRDYQGAHQFRNGEFGMPTTPEVVYPSPTSSQDFQSADHSFLHFQDIESAPIIPFSPFMDLFTPSGVDEVVETPPIFPFTG